MIPTQKQRRTQANIGGLCVRKIAIKGGDYMYIYMVVFINYIKVGPICSIYYRISHYSLIIVCF